VKSEQSVVQEFLYEGLTYAIIGAAMEVHRILGPGFLESVYEEALAHEFDLRGIPYERQAKLAVQYKGIVAGEFRADFLVDGKVVVELKAVKALTEGDEAQLLNYLKGTGYRVGLLLNFGVPSLEHKRGTIKRCGNR
jgi:GxxExxY protein